MSSVISPEGLRPLTGRPDLEFERKRAKKLVRAEHGSITLATAQLRVAREYGFASWRKLVAYYTTWESQLKAGSERGVGELSQYESSVRQIQTEFRNRHEFAEQPPDVIATGAALSSYVPRFYGLSDTEIFASTLTEADAQLVVARRARHASWSDLCEAAAIAGAKRAALPPRVERKLTEEERKTMPSMAERYGGEYDRARIAEFFEEKPTLLRAPASPDDFDMYQWRCILRGVAGRPDAHDVIDWMKSLGADVQAHLDCALLGEWYAASETSDIRIALDFGGNPRMTPSNGYSVLDHAIVRYANGEALDLLVTRISPPETFCTAAALGDVETMLRFVSRRGVVNATARRDALDMSVLSGKFPMRRPNAPNRDFLWEAFIVAAMNSRFNTMQALLDLGVAIDYSPVWYNTLHFCIDLKLLPVIEFLLAHGANPNFKAWPDQSSPLDIAGVCGGSVPTDPLRIQIHEVVANAAGGQ